MATQTGATVDHVHDLQPGKGAAVALCNAGQVRHRNGHKFCHRAVAGALGAVAPGAGADENLPARDVFLGGGGQDGGGKGGKEDKNKGGAAHRSTPSWSTPEWTAARLVALIRIR